MPGSRPRKGPKTRGQGAATAKQLGLFVEFNTEDMLLGVDETEDDGDLEAELLALTGETGSTSRKPAPKGHAPLPMAHIEKLAADCMRDVEEEEGEEEEGLEEDADLLTELQEVLSVDEETGLLDGSEATSPDLSEDRAQDNTEQPTVQTAFQQALPAVPQAGGPRGLQALLEERIYNYREAAAIAKEAGEAAKARRCDRGLKTLESQLATVRKGGKISEDEIPPPVALGKRLPPHQEIANRSPEAAPCAMEPEHLYQPEPSLPDSSAIAPLPVADPAPQALLLARQREYKVAALNAKRAGDLDRARELMRIGKRFDTVLEALEKGQPVDLSGMPPAPDDLKALPQASEAPTATRVLSPVVEQVQKVMASDLPASVAPAEPKTVLDALQQRLNRYREAGIQARASGNERKARMHDRIAKQYQDAVRAHQAGQKVDFAELPVPPGFPPIPGLEPSKGAEEDSMTATLASAQKLASQDTVLADEDEESDTPAQAPVAKKPAHPLAPSSHPVTEPKASSSKESLSPSAREQLALLEARKLQYQRAALQAKRRQDLEQAKSHLRVAKNLEVQIAQARAGQPIDLSKMPSPLTDEEGDFILIHHEDLRLSQKAEEVYVQLQKILLEQHEKCLLFSKQFMHQGNVAETTRFEKLAQDRKKQLEILQLAQAQGLDPPSHHFELKTFQTVRIFSELNSTEMHLIIVRGMNLPAPPGVTPDDLDAFVRFEFHYPNSDQAQKSKTAVVKNTNSPEFEQVFKLNINRNHRGFKRVIQSKGIKFEIFHKGSFFRSDKLVGTAHLKLERLENECEIREIMEVLDGRKPTGGKLEVKVRLREPLSGQDVQVVTENWLVLEPRGL
ncbi:coiled-coil and C2 domain-containing protein 1B isoform X1 [Alexandromys fortis]|uniref:coiled-coil and C2 domain-containing protein 1B isoform X1 n=1 Tax=Alexandromys fortis TaxID=100897 RepID=UPI002152BFB8|nr:coiled-coil and C2 domain-containing protein 1B isoform X1 [Microtus fortis]XP_049992067.1 coiled-coil and C2 domain-containing protein 1B isoform X1 [Microtus fortis]XP_049992068.1 coiled-coil and C2 domain-containing protein 1B isoform X1 [Microtus fortis]